MPRHEHPMQRHMSESFGAVTSAMVRLLSRATAGFQFKLAVGLTGRAFVAERPELPAQTV